MQGSEQIIRGDLERILTATGIIKPEEGAEVKTGSRFTGVIETLYVKLGDTVTKGQPIALLDKREQEAECRKVEAVLAKLQAELLLLDEHSPLLIKEAEASLRSAEAEVEYAETYFSRIAPLPKSGGIAVTDLDRARQQRASTKQMMIARAMILEQLTTKYRLERPRLQHAIEEAEAELEAARIRLSYATIVSPIDGVVSGITAQEGETVVAGFQVVDLITVLDVSRLELRVYVDENDIGEVKLGDTVRFRVEAYPDKQFGGNVALIHPGPELRNNIVYYRALVRLDPETARALRPEMTARCEIVVGKKDDVLLIPNTAFKWIGQRRIILRLDASGKPAPVDVLTGMEGMTHTEVVRGLEENAVVVTRVILPDTLPPEWKRP
ncbi:MAG: efflux RND transporter periplasmic adaptor subunit [Desulfovibrio sp.]|nr:efflux RND transporter periplasmic adaptor subunit [Desulfovibrio sp.]